MKKLKGNNKGFSLVELIVVIAIMGILAVTLAPRLSSYVEKARMGSDQEVANAVYTAARLAVLDEKVMEEVYDTATYTDYVTDLAAGIPLGSDTANAALYLVAGKSWTLPASTFEYAGTKLFTEIKQVVGTFKLKSAKADDDSQITLKIVPDADGVGYLTTVTLLYSDGTTYEVSDTTVR